jgi:hypothetical protein
VFLVILYVGGGDYEYRPSVVFLLGKRFLSAIQAGGASAAAGRGPIAGELSMTEIDSKRRRVWFITGTSSGMGYAVAKAALEHGDRVTATARNISVIEELADSFPGQGAYSLPSFH